MVHRIGKANLLLVAGILATACSGEEQTNQFPAAGVTGGATAVNTYTTPLGQGGGVNNQTGVVGVGGAVVGQGGAVGTVVNPTVGGATTVQTSTSVTLGGSTAIGTGTKATGGAVTTGGTKATGGAGGATGGTKATGGAGGATGGVAGGTGTAVKNIFTVGPYTGAGWVSGGTNLTTFTNPTVSGTTQTFASTASLCMTGAIPALQKCTVSGVTCTAAEAAATGGMNYSANWGALLGLNTTATEGTPKGTTFSKIAVTYTGTVTPATADVRLQVQLKDGTTYCNKGYPSGLQLEVASLTKDCYAAGGTALTTAATANITSIQLLVSAGTAAETFTNLCMTNIVLDGTTTDPGTTVTCNDTASATGTLTGQYGHATIPTTSGNKSYILTSNWWGKYVSQSISYSGLSFTNNGLDKNMQDADFGNPVGYPSLYIGTYAGYSSTGSNLPKQVSALTTVPTVFNWSGATDVSQFNAAYDVWLTSSSSPLPANASTPGTGGAYLMVWMFAPTDKYPRGTKVSALESIAGVSGSWSVYYDASNPPCVSYVANTKVNTLSFDLNAFIKNAIAKNWGVTNSQYLSVIFGGFEIWNGGTTAPNHNGLKLDKFCAHVN